MRPSAALIADGFQNLCIVIFSIITGRKPEKKDKDGGSAADVIDATDTQAEPGQEK